MPRPRVLLVHGSVVNGDATWAAQKPLAERFELVIPNRRGFPPGPDVESVDYEDEAAWLDRFLEPGAHLVGHSYGGVIALFAAARRPELVHSLTVVEPPALAVARGNPAADEFAARSTELWQSGAARARGVPARLPRRGQRAAAARRGLPRAAPGRADADGRALSVDGGDPARRRWRQTPFPKLVVSGGHSEAFDAVCDVLEERLGAERAVLPGAGHAVQLLGEPFNELLAGFVERAEQHDRT